MAPVTWPSASNLIAGQTLTYNTRGTVGDQNTMFTTQRLDVAELLYFITSDLRFYEERFFERVTIPRNQNELVHWDIDKRATGSPAVWLLNEAGRQAAGNNSAGNAQTEFAEVPSFTLQMDSIEAKPKRYGCIYRYTAMARSVAKRDPVERALREIGLLVAEQLDALVKGMFDSFATDVYPKASITAETGAGAATFLSTDVLNWAYLVKLEALIKKSGFLPPGGTGNYPVIIPPDAEAALLMDESTQRLLRETGTRNQPMSPILTKGFIGSLRCFDLYVSNRLTSSTMGNTGAQFAGGRGYIFTDQAIGCVAMEDPDYGSLPNSSGNNRSGTGWEVRNPSEMPRPVSVMRREPAVDLNDPFGDLGLVSEKHTVGFQILNAGRIFRFMFAMGASADLSTGVRVGTVGSA